ncbi:hypothetical protein DL770_006365 [Monosporascus sp. CRB-9-2]|nr:hypothetical protein DL770_006365 [Monosporascus sp. CRB-9-2]
MAFTRSFTTILAVIPLASLLLPSVSGIKLWNNPGDIPTSVPARCRAPLTQNISCEFLVKPDNAANGEIVPGGALDELCGSTCRPSLETFQKNTASGCGDTYYALWENSNLTQSPKVLADGFVWAHTLARLSDADRYCLAELHAGNKTECSECALKYGAVMAHCDFYEKYCLYDPAAASPTPMTRFPAVCYPDRSDYYPEPIPTPVPTPRPVQDGMAEGCSKFYKVKSGDTCDRVTKANNTILADFYKWNPSVGTDCRNLQLDVYVRVGYDERMIPMPQPKPIE